MATRVTINATMIDSMMNRPTDLRRYMQSKVNFTVVYAKGEAPWRTGALARSIGSTYHGRNRWTIGTSAKHAKFIHNGTKPHLIRAGLRPGGRQGWLKFHWVKVGSVVYLRQVNHPGTKANPFLVRAMKKAWS